MTNTVDASPAEHLTLLHGGEVFEARALGMTGRRARVDAGFFVDSELAAKAIVGLDRQGPKGIYTTLNSLPGAMHARIADRIEAFADGLTKDNNITRRRWYFLDFDPVREGGVKDIGATDAEKARALERAEAVRDWLMTEYGWGEPILQDSGNGYYLLFPILLPNDDESTAICEGVIEAIANRWSDAEVDIDRSVFNASRILRVAGTTNRKGDNVPDRPHRVSRLLHVPDYLAGGHCEPIPRVKLEAVARLAQKPKELPRSSSNGGEGYQHRLDVSRWLSARGVAFRVKADPSDGRTVFVLKECPFNSEHKDPDSCVMQDAVGQLSAKCLHASCKGKGWAEFKAAIGKPDGDHYDPPLTFKNNGTTSTHQNGFSPAVRPPVISDAEMREAEGSTESDPLTPRFRTIAELKGEFPHLRPAVIEGLLRLGETLNIISATKIGKSWLVSDLALSIITARRFLDLFTVVQGDALIIDNELHPETVAYRIPTVAEARGIHPSEYADALCVENLRGRLADIFSMERYFRRIDKDRFRIIVVDAWYRMIPEDGSENDNALVMRAYNASTLR